MERDSTMETRRARKWHIERAGKENIVYSFIPLAENTARKWFKVCNGEARGLDLDDVLTEAVALMPSIAKTYRAERGTVVAVVKPAVWRHLDRKFASTIAGETERLSPLGVMPEGESEPTQERAHQLARVQEWANTPDRRALLAAMDSPGVKPKSDRSRRLSQQRHAELLAELRAYMSGEKPARPAKLWSVGRAARYLRRPERQVRKLCERGELAALPERGWLVSRRDADAYRRRRIRDELDGGATVRAAARAAHCARETARQVLSKMEPRARGRVPLHDRAEILSALTDELRAPHTWRRGLPCLRAVARYVGCDERVVRRVFSSLADN